MSRKSSLSLLAATLIAAPLAGQAGPVPAAPAADPAAGFARFMDRLRADPNATPGVAVMVVRGDRVLFARAYGMADRARGTPLTLDTPMYNGSITKAYTGILAALLDADGTLPLQSTLADTWPSLTLRPPLDARRITAAQLLSHVSGAKADPLELRSIYTGQDSAAEVRAALARQAVPTSRPGFIYQNFGPYIWSKMAEQRTGRAWRNLLRQRVLRPLGLRRSTARLEDFGADGVSHCHLREARGWTSQRPKPTATLNAAGGMYTSITDAGRFLQAAMTEGASAGGAIPAAVWRRSWQQTSVQDRTNAGMRRDGYGLGWDLGIFDGHRFIARSGDFPGCTALMLFVPAQNLGVVTILNGALAPGQSRFTIVQQAIDAWSSTDGGAEARGTERLTRLMQATAASAARAAEQDPTQKARPYDPAAWSALLGDYRHPEIGTFRLRRGGRELRLRGGAFDQPLYWTGGDAFLVRYGFDVTALKPVRGPDGRVSALEWDGTRYDRVAR